MRRQHRYIVGTADPKTNPGGDLPPIRDSNLLLVEVVLFWGSRPGLISRSAWPVRSADMSGSEPDVNEVKVTTKLTWYRFGPQGAKVVTSKL